MNNINNVEIVSIAHLLSHSCHLATDCSIAARSQSGVSILTLCSNRFVLRQSQYPIAPHTSTPSPPSTTDILASWIKPKTIITAPNPKKSWA